MRKPTMLGAAAVLLTGALGYALLISPQATAITRTRAELASVEVSNQASAARIPKLKAQLANIASSVADLRALSGRVPPAIDLPALYGELDGVAVQAGPGVSITNVTVTVPALLAPPEVTTPAAATPTATATPATGKPAVTAKSVLASYQVNIEVKANPDQAAAFIKALGEMKRLNVVSVSGLTSSPQAQGTVRVAATFYLQQVDVDGLAAQIESLAKAPGVVSAPSPGAAPATTPSPTGS